MCKQLRCSARMLLQVVFVFLLAMQIPVRFRYRIERRQARWNVVFPELSSANFTADSPAQARTEAPEKALMALARLLLKSSEAVPVCQRAHAGEGEAVLPLFAQGKARFIERAWALQVQAADVARALRQMDALVAPGGWLCFDTRNWDYILQNRPRFYLYDPLFDGDTRINLIQVWDYELDGSVLFHLLYTFERENHIFQKEKFEEHYHPFSRALWEQTLSSLGYQNLQILPFPAQRPYAPGSELDWYTVLAQKPES